MAYAVSVAQSSVAFADTTSAMSSVSQVDTVHVQPVMANAEEFKAAIIVIQGIKNATEKATTFTIASILDSL